MKPSRISSKLKKLRRTKGYSQKKVARMLGLRDTSMLSRWEHGISLPSLLQAFGLSKIYGVFPHELYAELWNQNDSDLFSN